MTYEYGVWKVPGCFLQTHLFGQRLRWLHHHPFLIPPLIYCPFLFNFPNLHQTLFKILWLPLFYFPLFFTPPIKSKFCTYELVHSILEKLRYNVLMFFFSLDVKFHFVIRNTFNKYFIIFWFLVITTSIHISISKLCFWRFGFGLYIIGDD